MTNLVDGQQNENLERLYRAAKQLVPFIGAGFSRPFCPGWEEFLGRYFQSLKDKRLLMPDEIEAFAALENSQQARRLEKMADFLAKKSPGPAFKDEMKRQLLSISQLKK